MENKLFCEECQKEGLKSTVLSAGGSSTLLGTSPFYDEDGNYHYHDPNRITNYFRCSNGHNFVKYSTRPCPNQNCNYGK